MLKIVDGDNVKIVEHFFDKTLNANVSNKNDILSFEKISISGKRDIN